MPNKAPAPNRRPRFPLGAWLELDYTFCAPPSSSAVVGEAPRWPHYTTMKNTLTMLIAIGSLIVLVGCSTVPCHHGATEYRVDRVEFKQPPGSGLQEHLNTMSKDGWKLVQFVEHDSWYRVVMSRPER